MKMHKGWKKTTDNKDGKSFYHINPISGMDVGNSLHLLTPTSAFTHDLKFHVRRITRQGTVFDKKFNSLKKATSFAESYLKSHPNG